jgi:hypothetical protein
MASKKNFKPKTTVAANATNVMSDAEKAELLKQINPVKPEVETKVEAIEEVEVKEETPVVPEVEEEEIVEVIPSTTDENTVKETVEEVEPEIVSASEETPVVPEVKKEEVAKEAAKVVTSQAMSASNPANQTIKAEVKIVKPTTFVATAKPVIDNKTLEQVTKVIYLNNYNMNSYVGYKTGKAIIADAQTGKLTSIKEVQIANSAVLDSVCKTIKSAELIRKFALLKK